MDQDGTRTQNWGALSQRVIEKIKTNSALNPLLWLCGLALIPLLAGTATSSYPVNLVCLFLTVAVVVAPLVAYFILLFREPNRLQSEDYQIERFRLEHSLLGDSGTDLFRPSELSSSDVKAIENKS
jgi:hypothetical protein